MGACTPPMGAHPSRRSDLWHRLRRRRLWKHSRSDAGSPVQLAATTDGLLAEDDPEPAVPDLSLARLTHLASVMPAGEREGRRDPFWWEQLTVRAEQQERPVFDGRTYCGVWCFYQALKFAEEDPRRAEMAAGRSPGRGRVKPARRDGLVYEGREIGVNSVEHGVLVARATEAKVLGPRGGAHGAGGDRDEPPGRG